MTFMSSADRVGNHVVLVMILCMYYIVDTNFFCHCKEHFLFILVMVSINTCATSKSTFGRI